MKNFNDKIRKFDETTKIEIRKLENFIYEAERAANTACQNFDHFFGLGRFLPGANLKDMKKKAAAEAYRLSEKAKLGFEFFELLEADKEFLRAVIFEAIETINYPLIKEAKSKIETYKKERKAAREELLSSAPLALKMAYGLI